MKTFQQQVEELMSHFPNLSDADAFSIVKEVTDIHNTIVDALTDDTSYELLSLQLSEYENKIRGEQKN